MRNAIVNKNNRFSRLGSVCLLLCFVYAMIYAGSLPKTAYGIPTVQTEPVDMERCKFLQIVDDGSHLYVLSNRPCECVLVFDLDGNYRCTYYFSNEFKGILQLAADNGQLFVADAEKNVYIFENNRFVSFLPAQDAAHIFSEYEFGRTHEGYEMKFVSLWRHTGDESECVIQRSAYAALAQYHLMIFTLLFLSIGLGISRFVKAAKRTRDSEMRSTQ